MKVYINRRPVTGPWGGGNKFVKILAKKLKSQNYEVTYRLTPDVDIIFCFDPRPNDKGIWYHHFINHRLAHKSKIIQRVGDIGTHSKPELTKLVIESTNLSDYVIFTSTWAKDKIGYLKKNHCVIPNCPIPVFYEKRKSIQEPANRKKTKVVTHHWSTNEKKGFEYYEYLGKMIETTGLDIEFTYIGRYNESLKSFKCKSEYRKSIIEVIDLYEKVIKEVLN